MSGKIQTANNGWYRPNEKKDKKFYINKISLNKRKITREQLNQCWLSIHFSKRPIFFFLKNYFCERAHVLVLHFLNYHRQKMYFYLCLFECAVMMCAFWLYALPLHFWAVQHSIQQCSDIFGFVFQFMRTTICSLDYHEWRL